MLSLVYKDFLIQKGGKSAVYMLLMPVLSAFAVSSGSDSIFIILPYIAAAYIYIVYANALDDKYQTDRAFAAMPVSRGELVAAKFISIGIYLLLFNIIRSVSIVVMSFFIAEISIEAVFSTDLLIQFIFFPAVYFSIYFPLYFSMGYHKSRWANYIAMIAVLGIYTIVMKLCPELTGKTPDSFQDAIGILTGLHRYIINTVMPVLSGLMLFAAFRFSLSWYRQREFI